MQRLTITFCLLALLPACGEDEIDTFESGVEPAIVHLVPVDQRRGSFVLTLFLGQTLDASAEVWLHELNGIGDFTFDSLNGLSTEVAFPVVLEPGQFVRVPFEYALPANRCEHALAGTVYDSFKEDLTEVTSAAVLAPGCNP